MYLWKIRRRLLFPIHNAFMRWIFHSISSFPGNGENRRKSAVRPLIARFGRNVGPKLSRALRSGSRDKLRRRSPAYPFMSQIGAGRCRRDGRWTNWPIASARQRTVRRARRPIRQPANRDCRNYDEDAICAADHVIDIGPGAGVHGGEVVGGSPLVPSHYGGTGIADRL